MGRGSDIVSEPVKFYAFEGAQSGKKEHLYQEKKEHPLREIIRCYFSASTFILGGIGLFLAGAGFLDILYPFGIAWFAAASLYDKRRIFFWILPALFGYYWFVPQDFPIYAAVLLAEFFCFLLYSVSGKKSRYYLPIIVFSTTVVIRGLFLVFSGISDTLLVITLGESVLAAGLSYILYRAFEVWQLLSSMEKPGRGDILCILVLAVGLLLGMDHIAVYSVSPANIIMCLLILTAALTAGAGGGAAVGAVVGVIPSLSAMVSPSAIGVYAFSGFMAGIFTKFRRPGIIFGYLLGNLLLSLYLLNTTLLTSSVVETLIGAVLFLAIPKGMIFRLTELVAGQSAVPVKTELKPRNDEYAVSRLTEAGKNLSLLSDRLRDIHKEAEPKAEKNIKSILDHISDKVCRGCSLRAVCWDSDFAATYKDLMRVFALAEANDGITIKDLPEKFRRKCCHHKEITAAVNCLYELYRKNEFWQKQVVGSRYLALSQLDNTVRLLNALSHNINSYRAFKDLLNAKLGTEIRKKGLNVDKIVVESVTENDLGLRLKMRHCRGTRNCGEIIAAAIYSLTGKEYAAAECCCGGKDTNFVCNCRFVIKGAASLSVSSVQLTKEGSAVCGDANAEVVLSEAKEALMISDGMGSGPKARKESELTISLVKEVLECGFDRDFAAGLVSYLMLMDREDDIYATIDLCLLDLFRREAEFVKLGAGASYLCTPGKGMKVIYGQPMMVGFGGEAPTKSFKEEIRKGDIIILASDGICETAEGSEEPDSWLVSLVEKNYQEEAKVIGERIANQAVKLGGGKVRDDITVTVAKVV
ncbi:MAG TPA: SpoIIE family protein phosphatase [Clostridiales bacterium]|nr:SpoIIE family protein phosphatase [Clostridiales bacterium]